MPITERQLTPPDVWPPADELRQRLEAGAVAFLPDEVTEIDGETVASYRESAQALRTQAEQAGLKVEFVAPAGARLGIYRERAADWVLPFVLSIPAGVGIGLIVNEIQRVLDRAREAGKRVMPTVRFREVVIEEGRTTVRELSGPADELRSLLLERDRTPRRELTDE